MYHVEPFRPGLFVNQSDMRPQLLPRTMGRCPFGSPRSILRIKPWMYADGLLPEATTTTPTAT